MQCLREAQDKINMKKSLLIKFILSILFIGCLFDMPYGYFQIVRTVGMIGFIWLFNIDSNKDIRYLWAASAILINPIIKIPLGREIWNIVDIVWIAIFIGSILIEKKK